MRRLTSGPNPDVRVSTYRASRSSSAAGDRADLVERGSKRHQSITRDAPVGRLETDHTAAGRGLADRAPGVRPERAGHHAGGDGGGASARGAARDALPVPGVARDLKR